MTGQQKRQTAAALSCGDSSASVSSPTNITASGTVCGQVHILPIVESSSPVPGMAKWLYGRSTDAVKISTLATHHLQHDPRVNPAERPIAMAPTYHRETNGKMVLDVVKWKRPAAEDAVMPSSISGQGGRVAAPGLGGGPAPPAAFMNRGHHQQQQQQPAMVGKSGGGGAAAATTASDAAAKKAKEDEEARLKAEREALRLKKRNDSGSSKPPVSIPSVFANDGRAGGAAPPQQQAQQSYQPQGQQHQQLQQQQMQQQPPRSAVASGVVSPPPSLPLAFLSGSGNISQGDLSAPALLKEKQRTMDTKPSSMEEKRRDAKKATTVSTTKQTAQQKTQQTSGASAKQKQQQQQQQQSAPPPPAPVSIPVSFSNPGSATTLSRNVSAVPPPPPPANFVTAPSGGVVAPAVPGAFLGGRTTSSQAVSAVPPPPPPQIGKNRPRSGPASGQGSPMSVVVGSGAFPRAPPPAPPQAFVSVGAKEQQSLPPSSMYQQQRSGGHASTSSSASPVPSATISRSGGATSAAYHQVRPTHDHGVHHSGRNSGGSHPSYLERAQKAQDQRAWQSHPTAPPPSYAAASSSLGGAPGSSFGGAYGGGASKNAPRNEPAPQPQSSSGGPSGLSALGVQNHSRNKRARSKSVTPPPQPGDAQSGGVDADVGRRMFSDMPRGQVFVFDTCSMLNIDPRALKALAIDNTVVVPWVTVHELDNHNHNFEPNRNASGGGGDRSREDVARRRHLKNASREIRDVLSWGLELFRLQKRTEEGRGFDAANCKNNDDRILGCAVYFKDLDEMRSRNVLLVTDDGFLKIKARAEEVNAINVPELLAWPSRR